MFDILLWRWGSMSDGEGAGNALGDFGFSSESDVDVCRGCGQEKGHKADCAYAGGDAAPI